MYFLCSNVDLSCETYLILCLRFSYCLYLPWLYNVCYEAWLESFEVLIIMSKLGPSLGHERFVEHPKIIWKIRKVLRWVTMAHKKEPQAIDRFHGNGSNCIAVVLFLWINRMVYRLYCSHRTFFIENIRNVVFKLDFYRWASRAHKRNYGL